MGNICGKTESDPFDQPGRVLGSAPAPGPTSAPVPKKVGGPPRVLGGSSTAEASGNQEDARRKASEAALARAKAASTGGGKLQAQLTSQQKKSHLEHLHDASKTKRSENQSAQDTEVQRWD